MLRCQTMIINLSVAKNMIRGENWSFVIDKSWHICFPRWFLTALLLLKFSSRAWYTNGRIRFLGSVSNFLSMPCPLRLQFCLTNLSAVLPRMPTQCTKSTGTSAPLFFGSHLTVNTNKYSGYYIANNFRKNLRTWNTGTKSRRAALEGDRWVVVKSKRPIKL